jgi:hypothetical protein
MRLRPGRYAAGRRRHHEGWAWPPTGSPPDVGGTLTLKRALGRAPGLSPNAGHGILTAGAAKMAEKVKDPVCGMEVDPQQAAGRSEYQAKTYYFLLFLLAGLQGGLRPGPGKIHFEHHPAAGSLFAR